MDDQQKSLASKVNEKFEKPARDFLDNDINESLVCFLKGIYIDN